MDEHGSSLPRLRGFDERYAPDGTSLLDVLTSLEAQGFTTQLIAREGAIVECTRCHTRTPATHMVGQHRLHRLEGVSDPDDMLAVAGLLCPGCGARGTLVLKFGPEASTVDAAVLGCLDVPAGSGPAV